MGTYQGYLGSGRYRCECGEISYGIDAHYLHVIWNHKDDQEFCQRNMKVLSYCKTFGLPIPTVAERIMAMEDERFDNERQVPIPYLEKNQRGRRKIMRFPRLKKVHRFPRTKWFPRLKIHRFPRLRKGARI